MRRRLAIIGLGRVGRACGEAIAATEDFLVAGIVRRPQSLGEPLPATLRAVPVAPHASELGRCDAALICLPAGLVREAAVDLLQHGIPILEAAVLPSASYPAHAEAIGRAALRRKVAAIIGAGWNPGALSLFRGLFAVLCPQGHSELRDRPGVSLHHTLAARAIAGVRDALCTELRTGAGGMQRYVYLELEPGADLPRVTQAIEADPLFLDQETLALPVDSVAALEDEGHGVVLERWGSAGGKAHQRFLLEGRFDYPSVTAQVMVAAARALPGLAPGAHSLSDLPPAALLRADSD
jgi:diaminopimelate dehydrogenase